MLDELLARYHALMARLRRIERRELRELSLWLEHTSNLLQLSVLVFVPLLIGVVTWLSNASPLVSFLIFPPLASGTHTLFADPEGQYSSPTKFVGGMTTGAVCGWVALEAAAVLTGVAPPAGAALRVDAAAAALGVFLTGLATWVLDLEAPTAYSTGLLVLLLGNRPLQYVVGVALSSTLVAVVFVVWRNRFYEERARYLYRTTSGDDHVLVPMRGRRAHQETTADFGATVAADHDAGKVVLLDVVGDQATARAERALIEQEGQEGAVLSPTTDGGTGTLEPTLSDVPAASESDGDRDEEAIREAAEERAVAQRAIELEELADEIEADHGVPCEVVVAVAGEWRHGIVTDAVEQTGCDLVVTPYRDHDGVLSEFVAGLFRHEVDVIAFRSVRERNDWQRALVPVRTASDNARAMVDFARRLTGASFEEGQVGVCHCIDNERQRRRAETMLANLVDAFPGEFETRVSRTPIDEFLERNAPNYDVLVVGASTDRSAASRFLSPPTFTRLDDVETDVAIVHRGR